MKPIRVFAIDDHAIFLVVLLPTALGEVRPREVRLLEGDGKVGCEIVGATRTTRWWFQPESPGVSVEVRDAAGSRRHALPAGDDASPEQPSSGWFGRIARAIGVGR